MTIAGAGMTPNRVMFVGEAPGASEAKHGRPFVGKAGQELDRYLAAEGVDLRDYYRTNVVQEYTQGNPDPTRAQIRRWTPRLVREVAKVDPDIIVPVGAFATRWFLGDDAELEMVHGIPHHSEPDDRGAGAVVIPTYHPAFGFYDNDARALITYDFQSVAAVINSGYYEPRVDEWAGRESYSDVTGAQLAQLFFDGNWTRIGFDTEGYPHDPWSIQVSPAPGVAYILRFSQPDFAEGIAAFQRWADDGGEVVLHNAMYDVEMARVMGLELFDADLWDSMYAAYLMRLEPQGLKALAYRWTGMRMQSYQETIGKPEIDRQLDYLWRVEGREWTPPEERIVHSNDGTSRLYKPRAIRSGAEAVLRDWYAEKRDKNGNRTDMRKRWRATDEVQRKEVEEALGPFPVGTLNDIPLDRAVAYSCRDADAAIRLRARLEPALRERGLWELMETGMDIAPIFEEMQSQGLPASRDYFEQLGDEMWREMCKLQAQLSVRHYGGKPFNPASPKQVASLMRRRGLVGMHRTKTGAMSTGKKSIEHLRHQDAAIGLMFDWRERAKIKDSFCKPIVARIPEGVDLAPVRCTIKTTRVATRRIACSDPNLIAIPIRHELGRRVREGYRCPDGEVFGAWDLSQVEMRYMAHLSRDRLLRTFFHEGRDVHSETASRIFHVDLDDVHPIDQRYPAKRAGFGIITNISGPGLYDQLRMFGCTGWDVDKCDRLIHDWLGVYTGVADFLDACKEEVRDRGLVHDRWGMPRYLPGVHSTERKIRGESERAASSHKIQGGAQGMLQNSMRWLKPRIRELQRKGRRVRWVLQIHDELMLRFDEDLWPILDPLVREALTQHHGVDDISIPIEADGGFAQTWGGLK